MVATAGPDIDYERLIHVDKVHCTLYTSEELFEAELDKVWYREWIYVGHASEVPVTGDYALKHIGLQPVIMSRDEDGGVNLLLNHCAHRGASVCQQEQGNANAFRCWYHGWTYNNKGDLVGVTFPDGFDASFRREEFGLARVPRVASYRGFVFGSMSAEGISLDEHLGHAKAEVLDRLCDLSPEGEVEISAGWLKHEMHANWKMMMENVCDFYHGSFAHQASRLISTNRSTSRQGVAGIIQAPTAEAAPTEGPSGRSVVRYLGGGHADTWALSGGLRAGSMAGIGESGRRYYESLLAVYGEDKALELMSRGAPHAIIFPNLFVAGQNLFVARPTAVGKMVSHMTPVYFKGAPDVNERQLRRFEGASGPAGFLEQDDGEIWERNQRGLQARLPEWQVLKRGLETETVMPNGIRVSKDQFDGISMRGFWEHYKKLALRP